MTYYIFKIIDGIGLRYLAGPGEPIKWVQSPKDAYEFTDPDRWARMLGAQTVEVEDQWAGPGNR